MLITTFEGTPTDLSTASWVDDLFKKLLCCNAYIAITLKVVNFMPLYVYHILVLIVFLLSM